MNIENIHFFWVIHGKIKVNIFESWNSHNLCNVYYCVYYFTYINNKLIKYIFFNM